MKSRLYLTALAAGVASFLAFSASANALPLEVVLTGDNTTTFPTVDVNLGPSLSTNPSGGTPDFQIIPPDYSSTGGSFPGYALNPWADLDPTKPFSVIDPGSGTSTNAMYTQAKNTTTFSILWGSANSYNTITFNTSDGNSTTYNGSLFPDCCQSGVPTHDWATFAVDLLDFPGVTIASVVLSDSGTAAFEFSNATEGLTPAGATPLPAALSLFAGGLGLIGLLGRRKRSGSAALAA